MQLGHLWPISKKVYKLTHQKTQPTKQTNEQTQNKPKAHCYVTYSHSAQVNF